MAENVQLNIEIKGTDSVEKASSKLQSAKTQLREMKDLLASGSLSGVEFDKVAAKAAELEDRIGDVNARVKNLANDTSLLNGFTSVAQGIVGGFTAAQGAIALFGDENKDLQKTLVKVQGSVALLNGLQAVANTLNKDSAASTLLSSIRLKALTAIKERYRNVTEGAITPMQKFGRILGAGLGIGLVVGLLTALVTNFDKVKKAIGKFFPSVEQLTVKFEKLTSALKQYLNLGNDDVVITNKRLKANEEVTKSLEDELDVLRASGASKKQLYEAEKKLIDDRLALLQKASEDGITTMTDEMKKEKAALEQRSKILEATRQKQINDEKEANKEQAKKDRAEAEKNLTDVANANLKTALERLRDTREELRNANAEEDDLDYEQELKDAERDRKLYDQRRADYQVYQDSTKAIDAAIMDAKVQIASQGAALLEQIAGRSKGIALAGLLVEKGSAIASVIINTQREIAGYYTAAAERSVLSAGTTTAFDQALAAKQSIFAKVRAGLSIASITAAGLSSGKSILGGNAGGGFGGGGGTQAPQIRGFSTNSLPDRQTGQSGNVKVYVTETEISNTQNRVNGVYKRALVE